MLLAVPYRHNTEQARSRWEGGRFAHKDRRVQSADGVGSGSASSPIKIALQAISAASASAFSREAQ